MRITAALLLVALTVPFLSGCEPVSSRRLVLPEGDVQHGQELFVNLQCTACHTVRGMDLPAPDIEREYSIVLGGHSVKSYAELVTSVINPSHRFAGQYRATTDDPGDESPMTVYNDVMTVTELVDVVAFLEAQYQIEYSSPRYRYVPYRYPDE